MEENNQITFYKNNDSYYLNLNNLSYELSKLSLDLLKKELTLPFKIIFDDIPKKIIKSIINNIVDNTMDMTLKEINDNKYELLIYRNKVQVSVYEINYQSMLYGRKNECNPYLLTNINNIICLIETPSYLANFDNGRYYFLEKDLTDDEKEFFDILHKEITCDYIYNIDNKKKIKKK